MKYDSKNRSERGETGQEREWTRSEIERKEDFDKISLLSLSAVFFFSFSLMSTFYIRERETEKKKTDFIEI